MSFGRQIGGYNGKQDSRSDTMHMYVIGTAGHVDHGKSTLVEALTGINPDRLAEEQRREMTIDLGFAWLSLPSGQSVSIIDVPGHERFIKNMLAGVGGVDAALLVIAADEGIMPQTIEHMHILDLLEITQGLIVLTKCDLVDDEWLALMQEEVREHMRDTVLADAPLIPVSARTGFGLDDLRHALDTLLEGIPSRAIGHGAPRLPIDRAFTVGGFGTVVTGTLLDGRLAIGNEIVVEPGARHGRVRGLQTHSTKVEQAFPGTRVAINIAGLTVEDIRRGDVVTLPGTLIPTQLIDLKLQLVSDAPRPLEQNDGLDLFVGAAEVTCNATLLDRDILRPGEAGWVQLRLARPLAIVRGDRCIVRIPSPSLTIGGGRIVDAHPHHHRRFRADVIQHLETLSRGTPAELLIQAADPNGPIEWDALQRQSGLEQALALQALQESLKAGTILHLGTTTLNLAEPTKDTLLISASAWNNLTGRINTLVHTFHTRNPLRTGILREELKSKLGIRSPRTFNAVLQQATSDGLIVITDMIVHLPGFTPKLTPPQRQIVDKLLHAFAATPFSPPARADWETIGPDLLTYLVESGQLVRVSSDVYFSHDGYLKLVEWTTHLLDADGEVTVASLRDQFATSRKYALALLEHLDERKLTRRVGDVRVKY